MIICDEIPEKYIYYFHDTIYCDRGRIETLLVFKYGCIYFEVYRRYLVSLVVGRTSSTILSKQRFLPILAPEMSV